MEPEQAETYTISEAEDIAYPPKYSHQSSPRNLWTKSVISLLFYLAAGYFFFPDYKTLFLITAIIIIHELGHFIAMKIFGYNDVSIFFIPLLGAYVSGAKREVSQIQSAIILLAGPLPGIVIGILLLLMAQNSSGISFFGVNYYTAGLFFLLLNLLNLLPIYPLDGGQLLNRVFLDEESLLSKAFVFVSALLMCWFVWAMYQRSHSPILFVLLLFPLNMLLRQLGANKLAAAEKKIEEKGINTDIDYADLPDKDYWKIRDILIQTHPHLRNQQAGPPYRFAPNEEKMVPLVQSLLHRHLIQDMSLIGKLLTLLIWVAAVLSPWLLQLKVGFLNNFGL